MKPTQDIIYVVSHAHARAEALREVIDLRGVDEIITLPFDSVLSYLPKKPPVLVIIDVEDDHSQAVQILSQLPSHIKRIVLADSFDEEAFLSVYDHGVRDYLINPVPNAYLVSTVIRLLQERRQQQIIDQKDHILEELGVLSPVTNVFTTAHLLKMLESEFKKWQQQGNDSLCLLVVQLSGWDNNLQTSYREAILTQVAHIVKDCARDADLVGELMVSKLAVILPHTAIRGARSLAKRLVAQLHQTNFKGPNGPLDIQIMAGIADAAECPHYEAFLERALEDLQQHVPANPNSIHII
jgi:PleD family two-component response regulator